MTYYTSEYGYLLDRVFVTEEHRGKGVGHLLVRHLTRKVHGKADEFKRIFVETYVSRSKKRLDFVKFLRKMGFMPAGETEEPSPKHILRYERAEIAVSQLVLSDRFAPLNPETLHYDCTDD